MKYATSFFIFGVIVSIIGILVKIEFWHIPVFSAKKILLIGKILLITGLIIFIYNIRRTNRSKKKMNKALLFINGEPPIELPNLQEYKLIACTDGAFKYLTKLNFPLEKLNFVSGDFDSFNLEILRENHSEIFEIIETPDQNKTDFRKALEIIQNMGYKNIDVYGASGGEQDHFLGNVSVALLFKDNLNLNFFDNFSSYFFINKDFSISGVKDKTISLIPFPIAKDITTTGLKWPLTHEDLSIGIRLGTRNIAEKNNVSVHYKEGDLLFFMSK